MRCARHRWTRGAVLCLAMVAAVMPVAAQRRGPGGYAPVARFRQEPGAGFDRPWGDRPGEGRAFSDRRVYRDGRYGRIRCRDSGAGGSLVGAIAGGLLGGAGPAPREGMGGPVNGAGALGGRTIDRGC